MNIKDNWGCPNQKGGSKKKEHTKWKQITGKVKYNIYKINYDILVAIKKYFLY